MDEKEFELGVVRNVLSSIGIGDFNLMPGERPDVRFTLGNRMIGVEVTRFFADGVSSTRPMPEQISLWNSVATRATELHNQSDIPVASVSFSQHTNFDIAKSDVRNLSEDLLQVFSANCPPQYGLTSVTVPTRFSKLMKHRIGELMVFRSPNQTQAWWTADQSGWEDAWDAKRVTAELMGKEEKAASYKRRCDEVWLAISIGKGQVATPISLTENAIAHTYESGFARIFVDSISQGTFEISTTVK